MIDVFFNKSDLHNISFKLVEKLDFINPFFFEYNSQTFSNVKSYLRNLFMFVALSLIHI